VIDKFKNYFTYNKKERNGILLLSFVLFLLIIFYQFTYLFVPNTKTDFSEFEKAIAELEYSDKETKPIQIVSLFEFNPNSLDDNGWLALGLSEGKLIVLRNYQKSGGYFKQKKDLKRCYAIGDDFYDKIQDYVIIPKVERPEETIKKKEIRKQLVELNLADSLELVEIKGIGPFYAKQILKYRNELGGFISYKQFAEIWGLENLNIKKLKSQSRIDSIYISKRNINSLTFEELRIHPYINYKEAKIIVNFRKQHGDFQSIKDIQKIKLITPEIFCKIAPYFKTND
jgi:DNA uptake protein ComE-like DNA-binding protein